MAAHHFFKKKKKNNNNKAKEFTVIFTDILSYLRFLLNATVVIIIEQNKTVKNYKCNCTYLTVIYSFLQKRFSLGM